MQATAISKTDYSRRLNLCRRQNTPAGQQGPAQMPAIGAATCVAGHCPFKLNQTFAVQHGDRDGETGAQCDVRAVLVLPSRSPMHGGWWRDRTSAPLRARRLSKALHYRSANHPASGAGARNRTPNLRLTRTLLCQLSYAGEFLVRTVGIEPTTPWLETRSSAAELSPRLVRTAGLEPTSREWRSRVLPLNYVRTYDVHWRPMPDSNRRSPARQAGVHSGLDRWVNWMPRPDSNRSLRGCNPAHLPFCHVAMIVVTATPATAAGPRCACAR